MYHEPKNSPFVPNVQKQIFENEKPKYEKPKYEKPEQERGEGKYLPPAHAGRSQPQPLVDLQVYNPPRPPPKKKQEISPAMYMPIPTQPPYFPPQMNPMWPYYYPQMVSPVIKQYSINDGPFVNYSTLSVIKEDSLPGQFDNTSNSVGERINMYNFVRSVFIKHYDGEDINLDGKGDNSLLSYLKFLELNPYHKSADTRNPYKGLPNDMVIYRSCYPIRYDHKTNSVQCAVNSIGMNIRVYKLTLAEYNIKKLQDAKFYEHNVWREVAYYEYIREQILKRKVCPNFVLFYCYYISENCNINFNKVKSLNGSRVSLNDVRKAVDNGNMAKKLKIDVDKITKSDTITLPPPIASIADLKQHMDQLCKDGKPTIELDLDSYSGKGLVALTEAPTYNIYGWSSRKYSKEGNVHKMINSGYHKSEVWISVLFQIMAAMYTLQLHKIAFRHFTIEDNVYIKDTTQHDNIVTYWKYIINNFEYYVPNYGYLVLIDSNYKDIDNHYTLGQRSRKVDYKIYSNIFCENDSDEKLIEKACFDAFKEAINPNTFSNAFTNFGGTPPPEDIQALLGKIYSEATQANAPTDISYYIYKCMSRLLNNRVGTYLSETEIKNIRAEKDFKPGQVIAMADAYERYQFVVFVKNENGKNYILTKNNPKDPDVIVTEPVGELFSYSTHEQIVQNYKPTEANLNEDELIEVYVVSK